jgi:hypothetical protein
MLDAVTESTGQRLTMTFKSSCLISPDLTITFDRKPYEPCRQFAAGEMERSLRRLGPGDVVVISTWLNRQLGDIERNGKASDFPVNEGRRRLTPEQVRQSYVASTRRFARQLAGRGIDLVLVVDVPELLRDPVVCEAWSSLHTDTSRGTICAPPPGITARMQATVRDTLQAIAAGMDNVHVFDPTALLTDDGRTRHRLADGTLLYSDWHHLSWSGSRMLADPFLQFLEGEGLLRAGKEVGGGGL